MHEIVDGQRVHVVDDYALVEIITLNAQITSVVSDNYLVAKTTPLSTCVELLVEPSIETEGGTPNSSSKSEVVVTLFETL